MDAAAVAARLRDAYARRAIVPQPSTTEPGFDLAAAYAVERELVAQRRADGHRAVGVKVGYANKAVWRALKLDTLVWAHMYDDTVHVAADGVASLSVGRFTAPKIEPEIVFKLKAPLEPGLDAAAVLARVEWLALGFEIIDCVFPEWTFQPADFVAAYGLHAALIVGPPRPVVADAIQELADALPKFTVRLLRNGEVAAEGSGRNSLRSPALCVAELGSAMAARGETAPLSAGALISSGTLTESQPLGAGETWTASVDGIDLTPVTLHTTT